MGLVILISFIILFVLLHQRKMLAHKAQLIDNENRHQKQLLEASLEVAEQERTKVAANMHDDVGMMLNVLKMNLNRAHKSLDDRSLLEEILNASYGILDNSIETIRAISNDLMPPTLIKLGFVKGISELCRQINLSEVILINHSVSSDDISFDKKIEFQLYRLIKEIINNTIKHTGAKQINLEIKQDVKNLHVCIAHDGKGITTQEIVELSKISKGLGLKSILSRAKLINAIVNYEIPDNGMARVTIDVPVL